jgi:uncharacterized protein
MIFNLLRDYKLLNCEVLVRDDHGIIPFILLYFYDSFSKRDADSKIATVDDLIDVIMKDHRKYIRWYFFLSFGSNLLLHV